MITGIVTFVVIFAVIGSILYGQRLVKTEKSDAVFGNPERAKGGVHWVIVGSSFLLLSWLYYSWDIAKAFYPKSANELCQVAKVNESLLSLKYLFPIEERQHKSTALIKRENINIQKKIKVIQNSADLKNKDKELFIKLLNKTQKTIPLLTDELLMEVEIKKKIGELTNRIAWLTEDFQKIDYPPIKSLEEENKRIEDLKKQLGWGATGMEVPPLPESKRGLKFHAAAQELNEISDEFFGMRNHNPEYLKLLKEIREEIKKFGGEEIPNSIPKTVRADPFKPLNSILGPDGDRWAAMNAKMAHSDAIDVMKETEQLIENYKTRMDECGVFITRLMIAIGQHSFSYEPVVHWFDEWLPVHKETPEPSHLKTLTEPKPNAKATELVSEIREEVVKIFTNRGVASNQIGKTYPYFQSLRPETAKVIEGIKKQLDPGHTVNPGGLGFPLDKIN